MKFPKLRRIVIPAVAIGTCYYVGTLIGASVPDESQLINNNIAQELTLQKQYTETIANSESKIEELKQIIENSKNSIAASVEVVKAYETIATTKGYTKTQNVSEVLPTGHEILGASEGIQRKTEAPSESYNNITTGSFTCTTNGKEMMDEIVDDVNNYEFYGDCNIFLDEDNNTIKGCWVRTSDQANCFKH